MDSLYTTNRLRQDSRIIFSCLGFDSPWIFTFVVHIQIVCLALGRTAGIWIIKQILDSKQHLLNSNGWSPPLFFVKYRQADSTWWIDVRVKERRDEFALRRLWWVFIRKLHCHFIYASFPFGPILSRDPSLPFHKVWSSLAGRKGTSIETKRVVTTPIFSFLFFDKKIESGEVN